MAIVFPALYQRRKVGLVIRSRLALYYKQYSSIYLKDARIGLDRSGLKEASLAARSKPSKRKVNSRTREMLSHDFLSVSI